MFYYPFSLSRGRKVKEYLIYLYFQKLTFTISSSVIHYSLNHNCIYPFHELSSLHLMSSCVLHQVKLHHFLFDSLLHVLRSLVILSPLCKVGLNAFVYFPWYVSYCVSEGLSSNITPQFDLQYLEIQSGEHVYQTVIIVEHCNISMFHVSIFGAFQVHCMIFCIHHLVFMFEMRK